MLVVRRGVNIMRVIFIAINFDLFIIFIMQCIKIISYYFVVLIQSNKSISILFKDS